MSTSYGENDNDYSFPQIGKDNHACNAADFLNHIEQLWPSYEQIWPPSETEPVSAELVELIEGALAELPHSARIWCKLGDILQLGASSTVGVESALECYKKALEIDPLCGDAYEEIGFIYDLGDNPNCRIAFEIAVRCNGSLESYLALVRKCAEMGDTNTASTWLDQASQWFTTAARRIAELQSEIERGDSGQS